MVALVSLSEAGPSPAYVDTVYDNMQQVHMERNPGKIGSNQQQNQVLSCKELNSIKIHMSLEVCPLPREYWDETNSSWWHLHCNLGVL